MNGACQQANTTQQRFPWTCDTNEFGNKRDSREGVAGVCRKTIERALLFLFVCLLQTQAFLISG